MVNRQEYENLEYMLKKGIITEKDYLVHKRALTKKHQKFQQINLSTIDFSGYSFQKALKFSFNKFTFIATFFFLLISSIVLLGLYRLIWKNPDGIIQLFYFLKNQKLQNGIVFYFTTAFLYALWKALWFSFFSYLSFKSINQSYGYFSFKKYFKKSLFISTIMIFWFLSIVALWTSFVIHVLDQTPGISNLSFISWQHIPWLIIYSLIVFAIFYFFTILIMTLTGPMKKRYIEKAFWRGFKNPFYILKFWVTTAINIGFVILFFKYTGPILKKLYLFSLSTIQNANTLSSLISLICLFLVYICFYILFAGRKRFFIFISFLFLIPSAILYSMIPNDLSLQTTIIYFAFMYVIWFYFYVILFFTVQNIAFSNHSLTQIWCSLMSGEFIMHKPKKRLKKKTFKKLKKYKQVTKYFLKKELRRILKKSKELFRFIFK